MKQQVRQGAGLTVGQSRIKCRWKRKERNLAEGLSIKFKVNFTNNENLEPDTPIRTPS